MNDADKAERALSHLVAKNEHLRWMLDQCLQHIETLRDQLERIRSDALPPTQTGIDLCLFRNKLLEDKDE